MSFKTLIIALTVLALPVAGLAAGCRNGAADDQQAISCIPGTQWDAQSGGCIPVASS